ncbi:MAG: VCBS repeat-containing protein [Deltaproteobacteria bacterium]|nr:VCBS repeat-containing protein [Kofleriaceae bacterium]
MTTRLLCVLPVAALLATTTTSHASPATCPPLWERGVLELPWRPAFLHVDRYGDGEGLTISSFFNAYRNTQPGPPFITYARDRVARIPHLASVDPATFDAADLEELTDRDTDESAPGRTVWPNEAVRAPRGVFPFEAVVVPQGFHPAAAPGRLTAVDVATGAEYVIHQSTQAPGGFTNPFDPTNRPRFYHRVLFADMTGDGRADLVSARSGFRVGPFFYPPFAELVYFENPGDALDPATPWREVVLWGGPAAGFMGPDIHLDMFDFERDGVPEIVATHFFSGGTIALYGAPAGGTWADVDVLASRLPRVAVLSNDQGLPFDVQVADLDGDGRVDILASNHQPDGCTPQTSSPVPGRVFALEQPADSAIFTSPWTTHVLLDDIRSNPTMPGAGAPGRLAPGRAQVFWPHRLFEGVMRPWIVVGGDESGRAWILRPASPFRRGWTYEADVIFDINAAYGEGTTQTVRPPGVTYSTVGSVAIRYDRPWPFGFAELYVTVFEAHDIHVFTTRPGASATRLTCPTVPAPSCP